MSLGLSAKRAFLERRGHSLELCQRRREILHNLSCDDLWCGEVVEVFE